MAFELRGKHNKSKLMLAMLLTITLTGMTACSNTLHNAKTQNANLMDNDADGVINERDQCPDTLAGAKVNNIGCAEVVIIEAEDELHILFDKNSSKISADFMDEVDQLALFMTDFPETNVLLKGYASPTGAAKYNEMLSVKRANAVKNALVSDGIAPERISIEGFGENDPVAADSKMQTEILSRRVTATVSATQASVLMQWTVYTSQQEKM